MIIVKEGLRIIKHFEQFRATKYICPAGLNTIGYGHVLKSHEQNLQSITLEQAEELLLQDVALAKAAVLRNIHVILNCYQLAALVCFTFNVGAGALQRSTLRQKINSFEHHLVAKELQKWVFANGVKLQGLAHRRKQESILYYKV
jgi:GH24 family phage-related lysozyme (muramidase)